MADLTRWQRLWQADETLRPCGWSCSASLSITNQDVAADMVHMAALRWLMQEETGSLVISWGSNLPTAISLAHWGCNERGPTLDDALFSACSAVLGVSHG